MIDRGTLKYFTSLIILAIVGATAVILALSLWPPPSPPPVTATAWPTLAPTLTATMSNATNTPPATATNTPTPRSTATMSKHTPTPTRRATAEKPTATATPTITAVATATPWIVTVEEGDTMSAIALQQCGRVTAWPAMCAKNGRLIPYGCHLIYPGDRLIVACRASWDPLP